MKTSTKLLLLGLFLFGLFAKAQTVNIPDQNFKYALLHPSHFVGAEVIDTNNDGEIQYSEAEAVDTVAVGDAFINSQIQDMTGIAAFTNLKVLWCYHNDIASLDLSQNTNLEELWCQENQLTSLLFGNNPNLKTILCRDNLLTSLDVSQNMGLEEFRCQNNNLTSLDLSQNSSIHLMICNNNNLNYLDIRNGNAENITYISFSNNPNLTCVFVDDKEYWQNHFPVENNSNQHYVETQQECDALGVTEFSLQNIKIYPNPVKNKLYIQLNSKINPQISGQNLKVKIFNMTGKSVLDFQAQNLKATLQLSQLPPGMYFLQFTFKNQKFTKKIVKL